MTDLPGNVESPVVMTSGGVVMVARLSVVSVIETGAEEVDFGVSVSVLVGMPWVDDPVTEAGGDGVTDDELFDTVMVALLDTAGVTGETTLGDVGTPEAAREDSEDVVVETGVEDTPDELGEMGCDEDVIDTTEVFVVTNVWRFALGKKPLAGARLAG